MRAIILSRGLRPIESYATLAAFDPVIVTNTAAGAHRIRATHPDIPSGRIFVSDTPEGPTPSQPLSGQVLNYQWALDHLVEPGEWFLRADDNIRFVTVVPPSHYALDRIPESVGAPAGRALFAHRASPDALASTMHALTARADAIGAHDVGFAQANNWLWRLKHYRTAGFVTGKLLLRRHDPAYRLDPTISMEDTRNSAESALTYGVVLIDYFVMPDTRHYAAGGLGRLPERVAIRQQETVRLMANYPGFFRYKTNPRLPPCYDLAFRLSSQEQVAAWRVDMRRHRNRLSLLDTEKT